MSKNQAESILIGGAEGFLGKAAVEYFSAKGRRVVASCRTAKDLADVKAFVDKAGLKNVAVLEADLGDEAAVTKLLKDSGPIDGLFNAAGGFRFGSITECSLADFEFLYAANLKSSFLLAKHAAPGMKARRFGRMVFVSAKGTLSQTTANMGPYTATKAALNCLVEALAAEVKGSGVTVNAIMPTVIDTPANRQAMPDQNPVHWVTTAQLMAVVEQLMGEVGEPINGALIPVSGGL
jgi:NAD(P)-dependent dehydrogenase (short-subunit alcohol dehydrogenase family)